MGINLDCYACLRDRHRPLAFRYGGIDAEVRRLSYAAWILWHLGYPGLELSDAFAWLTDRSGSRPTVRIQLPPHLSLQGFGHRGESLEIHACPGNLRSYIDPERVCGGANRPNQAKPIRARFWQVHRQGTAASGRFTRKAACRSADDLHLRRG
jgi:hypothetical protein